MENNKLELSDVDRKITCRILNVNINDAIIGHDGIYFYILQNQLNGFNCDNKLGYSYSWRMNNNVTDIKFLDEDLLGKANREYPIGTKYLSAGTGSLQIVKGKFYLIGDYQITDNYGGSVYLNGKWAEIIHSKTNNMEYKITRSQMKQMYDAACEDWRPKIIEYTKYHFSPLYDEGTLPDTVVKELYSQATPQQKKLLDSIFPDYSKVVIIPKGEKAWVRSKGTEWFLRYSDGTGGFYNCQKKEGYISVWDEVLPFNKRPL